MLKTSTEYPYIELSPWEKQGELIRRLRLSQRMNQQDLARHLSIDRATISRYENNGCNRLDLICEMAKLFNIPIDAFRV